MEYQSKSYLNIKAKLFFSGDENYLDIKKVVVDEHSHYNKR